MKKLSVLFLTIVLSFVLLLAGCDSDTLAGQSNANSQGVGVNNSQGQNSNAPIVEGSAVVSNSVQTNQSNQTSNAVKSSITNNSTANKSSANNSSVKSSTTQNSVNNQTSRTSVVASNGTTGGNYPTTSGAIYVSTVGSDSNAGTEGSPMKTLAGAVSRATAGATIIMKKGTYPVNSRINLTQSGTESAPITIQAENWEEVIIDFSEQPYGFNDASYVGIYLGGNYWKIQGLTICHAGDNGIKVEGSHNYIGRCVLHHNGDTGIQLGFGHTTNNPNGLMCSYNTIENCDSYLNYDFDNHGDADGFACKMHNGKGNVFIGCRAWRNCDDAWDLFETDWAVEIIDCWAWESGKKADFSSDPYFSNKTYLAKKSTIKTVAVPSSAGNGNGIKLGGNGTGGSSKGTHIVKNCVSFGNDLTSSVKGFDQNNHTDGNIVENCVAWSNGYNFMFEVGSKCEFRNNLSMYYKISGSASKSNARPGEAGSGSVLTNNNFTSDGGDLIYNTSIGTLTEADFISISEEDAKAPRQSDGSLPNNGFARLKPSSPFYGKGMGLI